MIFNTFFNSICRCILKVSILIVHFFTRTPLIVFYYLSVCIGLFGPNHIFTSFCYIASLSLVMINVFVFVLFNNQLTKEWCINLVGKAFFDKYLTHSAPAAKSLTRLLVGIFAPCFVEMPTHYQNEVSHQDGCENVRRDIDTALAHGDLKAASKFQDTLRKLQENHKPGGLVSRAMQADTTVKTYGIVSDTAKSIAGKVFGR